MNPVTELLGLSDLLADQRLTAPEVHLALCSLLTLRPEDVFVVDDLDTLDLSAGTTRQKVFCLVTPLQGGEFLTLVSPSEYESTGLPRIPLVANLCRILGCRFLVDDGDVNPFTLMLVHGDGTAKHVSLDPVRMDANEYVIESVL